ncbi:hypothetical protein [Algicola sagamiensis]|uniref:hypothetical protein n=1 Tax=Algicola sagamiensis TaxID=163869 RepID=UPI00036B7D47|nr:hypothetical protein [Algicola sagamiensis]
MEFLMDLFTSSGVGAIIGTVGSWLTKREERESLKLKFQHQYNMAQLNASHALEQEASQRDTLQTQGKVAVQNIEAEAFKQSMQASLVNTGSQLVDGIRGLMRPAITIFLLVMSTLLALKIHALINGLETLGNDAMFELYRHIIMQLLFMTSTAVTWWFGSRPGRGKAT